MVFWLAEGQPKHRKSDVKSPPRSVVSSATACQSFAARGMGNVRGASLRGARARFLVRSTGKLQGTILQDTLSCSW